MGSRYTYHHFHRPGRAGRGFGTARWLVICAAFLAAVGLVSVTVAAALAVLAPFVLVGVGAFVLMRFLGHRNRRAVRGRQPAPMPAQTSVRTVTQAQPAPSWSATRARFAQLRSEYAQFECDPLAVLRLPALTDVKVPSTGRFVDAFAEAQALDTDTEPPTEHRTRYARAVDQAWRAWHAARDAAERIRLSGIPAQEHATVQRAIKLLTMARDSDHDAERVAAYAKARAELAKLERSGTLRLPVAAAAALEAASRGQLPAR